MTDQVLCQRCDRAMHDPEYPTCFGCFLERAEHYVPCLLCGHRHSPDYPVCFACRVVRGTDRADAAHRLRRHVLERDDYTCAACAWRSVAEMQVDHLKPCRAGGDAYPWNLVAMCGPCNRAKGDVWEPDGRWDQVRARLLHDYFLTLHVHLEPDQRVALREAIEVYRRAMAPVDALGEPVRVDVVRAIPTPAPLRVAKRPKGPTVPPSQLQLIGDNGHR
jgi:5-methylcytosine-specific restriction endonuclease McrA